MGSSLRQGVSAAGCNLRRDKVYAMSGQRPTRNSMSLARIIHERFCCNRRSAALASEAQDGRSLSVSSHAKYEVRFTRNGLSGGVATNRHE